MRALLLLLGAALLFVAVVFQFTGTVDRRVLHQVALWRSPVLTNVFISLTALGSTTLIALHTLIAFSLLISTRDKVGALQLVTASAGAQVLVTFTKDFIQRPRPDVIPALVDVTGYSFPSGHALNAATMYVTFTILATRHLPLRRQRTLVVAFAAIIVSGVGLSRVYLGVHYFTDVMTGMALGTAWALFVASLVSTFEKKDS